MTHSHLWHDSFLYGTWLIHMCCTTHWYAPILTLILMRNAWIMTHSFVWHGVSLRATRIPLSKKILHQCRKEYWMRHFTYVTHPHAWQTPFIWAHSISDAHRLTEDAVPFVTLLVPIWDVTHPYALHDSEAFILAHSTCISDACRLNHSHMWYDCFLCVCSWLIRMRGMTHPLAFGTIQFSFLLCATWIMTHFHVWHDSFLCGTWLIRCMVWLIHMSRFYFWCAPPETWNHDAFLCVTWLVYMCDVSHMHGVVSVSDARRLRFMAHYYVWHDSCLCVTWLICMVWLICMSPFYFWCAPHPFITKWDVTHPYAKATATVCCNVLQCIAGCCRVLQCVAVCCSVLQCVAVLHPLITTWDVTHPWAKAIATVWWLQYVAARCSVLQCVVLCHLLVRAHEPFSMQESRHMPVCGSVTSPSPPISSDGEVVCVGGASCPKCTSTNPPPTRCSGSANGMATIFRGGGGARRERETPEIARFCFSNSV